MNFTRRQWMGAGAAGMLGAVASGIKLSPIAQAVAATEADAATQLAALKSFTGKVPHATHYGPMIATVEKGRIVNIEAQDTDKMPTAMLTEGVLDRTMWVRTLLTGAWMGVGTLVVYHLAHDAGLALDHARTLALITMVMFNFFQVFSARAERRSLFTMNPFGNPLLVVSAIVALLLQWGATLWPVSADLIGLTPLSAQEWLLCTAIGSTVLLIVEAEKLIRRLAARRRR